MHIAISILQIILSVLLIVVILLQQKSAGLGAGFGGGASMEVVRRGVDKRLHQITIVLSVTFFTVALIQVVL